MYWGKFYQVLPLQTVKNQAGFLSQWESVYIRGTINYSSVFLDIQNVSLLKHSVFNISPVILWAQVKTKFPSKWSYLREKRVKTSFCIFLWASRHLILSYGVFVWSSKRTAIKETIFIIKTSYLHRNKLRYRYALIVVFPVRITLFFTF